MKKDYYELLGVGRDCDEKTLKAAFRKLAMQYHPDRNPGCKESEKKFKEIGEAYDILKDPQKRAAYDRFGHAAFEQGGSAGSGNPFHGFSGGFGGGFADIFEDMFGDILGGRQRRSAANSAVHGADLSYNLEISLEESYYGRTVEIPVSSAVSCEVCGGNGCQPGTKPKTCSSCGGRGVIRSTQGFFSIERPCPHCQGRGEKIETPCKRCHGHGRCEESRTLSVNVPRGIEEGMRIRLAGEGEAGLNGGRTGDLYIFVSIRQHEFFQRDGANLYCTVPITMTKAALGGELILTSLDGDKTVVKVPVGAQNGQQIRLKNKGMPLLRKKEYGDLYIELRIETPQNLTPKQKMLLEEFAQEEGEHNSPQSHGFLGKMRDFFDSLGKYTR